ncbi:hypothetical protein TNCV_4506671 [Trichonephila clavipes]|nr:hypothetical protein TNCV_4506671 [Trichonephila clavipes]
MADGRKKNDLYLSPSPSIFLGRFIKITLSRRSKAATSSTSANLGYVKVKLLVFSFSVDVVELARRITTTLDGFDPDTSTSRLGGNGITGAMYVVCNKGSPMEHL